MLACSCVRRRDQLTTTCNETNDTVSGRYRVSLQDVDQTDDSQPSLPLNALWFAQVLSPSVTTADSRSSLSPTPSSAGGQRLSFDDIVVNETKVTLLANADEARHVQQAADVEWDQDQNHRCGMTGTVVDKEEDDSTVEVVFADGEPGGWFHINVLRSAAVSGDGGSDGGGGGGSSGGGGDASAETLRAKVAKLEAEVEQLENEHIDELEGRDDTIEELRMKVTELEAVSSNSAAKAVIAAAQENIDGLTTRVEELESLLAAARAETEEARSAVAAATNQRGADANDDDADDDDRVAELEDALGEAEDRAERQKQQHGQMLAALEAAEARCDSLQAELDAARNASASVGGGAAGPVPSSAGGGRGQAISFDAVEIGRTVRVRSGFDDVVKAQALADMAWDEESRDLCGADCRVIDKDPDDNSVQVEFSDGRKAWLHHQVSIFDGAEPRKQPADFCLRRLAISFHGECVPPSIATPRLLYLLRFRRCFLLCLSRHSLKPAQPQAVAVAVAMVMVAAAMAVDWTLQRRRHYVKPRTTWLKQNPN